MMLTIKGDERYYSEVKVTALAYERTGESAHEPLLVKTCLYSNQFALLELISDISMECGIEFNKKFSNKKCDIREIVVEYK